jgi:transposase IS4-like protein
VYLHAAIRDVVPPAVPPADCGRHLLDRPGLGAVPEFLPPQLVDEVIEECGCREIRRRALPARVTAYVVLALWFCPGAGYGEVLRVLFRQLKGPGRDGPAADPRGAGRGPGPAASGPGAAESAGPPAVRDGACRAPAGDDGVRPGAGPAEGIRRRHPAGRRGHPSEPGGIRRAAPGDGSGRAGIRSSGCSR